MPGIIVVAPIGDVDVIHWSSMGDDLLATYLLPMKIIAPRTTLSVISIVESTR